MTQKAIIFDSGTLISFSMNGLINQIRKLKGIFKGKFLITNNIKREVIDKPLTIKRFELEALKIKQLFDEKIIELPSSLGIDKKELSKRTNEFLNKSNGLFRGEKDIHIIDSGEASALALSKILDEKRIKNVIAVDERTTRMLVEKPENLRKLLEKKLHTKITYNPQDLKSFQGFKIIRSAELIYVAYKKNLVDLKDGATVLDALLYAVKFKGCAISGDEIKEIKRIG